MDRDFTGDFSLPHIFPVYRSIMTADKQSKSLCSSRDFLLRGYRKKAADQLRQILGGEKVSCIFIKGTDLNFAH